MLLIYIDTQSFSHWCDVCFTKGKKIGAQKKKGKKTKKGDQGVNSRNSTKTQRSM